MTWLSPLVPSKGWPKTPIAFFLLILHRPCCNGPGVQSLDNLEGYDVPQAAKLEREDDDCR